MRRTMLALAAALVLLLPAAASAHPLGNFTVNQFTLIQPSGDRVYVLHVLDMAEIPTFEERDELAAEGRDAYAAQLSDRVARGLTLTADGRPLALEAIDHRIAFPAGSGDLPTTRLELVLVSERLEPGKPVELALANVGFPNRIGWREIVLVPAAGASVSFSSVPAESVSNGLRSYPEDDLLRSPPDVRTAAASVTPGEMSGSPPVLGTGSPEPPIVEEPASEDGFAALVARRDMSVGVVLVSLLVAMFWGAAHALSPGHGKAIVAAYLVGTSGTYRQALWLGLIVTVTHTIGVFGLGLVTLALSELIVPADLYPWINLAAALLVVVVGLGALRARVRGRFRHGRPVGGGQEHAHAHEHPHGHGHGHGRASGEAHRHSDGPEHDHSRTERQGWSGLLGVGISGGLLPCPSALVVLLAAISLHRVGYGLVLILAFSVGLAATITAIGLVAISARGLFGRWSGDGRAIRVLPALSALVIVGFGVAMTARAVPALG